MLNRFLHHNPTEANEPAVEKDAPEVTPDTEQPPVEGDVESGEGNKLGEGGTTPEGGEKKDEPTVKGLTAQLEEQAKKFKDVTTKLGVQSKHVKTLRDLQDALSRNPEKTLTAMAKRHGKTLFFEEPGNTAANISKVFSESSDDERGALMKELYDKLGGDLRTEFRGEIDAVYNSAKASQYPDWDDDPIVETIAGLQAAVDSGTMTQRELMYHASKGYLSADAITAAKAEGKAEYIAELQKKNQEELSPGGISSPSTEKEVSFEDVASSLSGII